MSSNMLRCLAKGARIAVKADELKECPGGNDVTDTAKRRRNSLIYPEATLKGGGGLLIFAVPS